MTIKRIPADKLEIGMYITDKTAGLAGGPFKKSGFIRKEKTLAKLQELALPDIFIDVDKGSDSLFSIPDGHQDLHLEGDTSLEEERRTADQIYHQALTVVDNLMQDAKMAGTVDVSAAEYLADDIIGSLNRNYNALLCLSQIRDKDKYLLEHSVNVGVLMGIFARFLGYEGNTLHQLVTGAVLHDIGKIRVPDDILNKPGKLEVEEWEEMKRHVDYGRQVLSKSDGVNDVALAICGLHHERLDGSGYPLGLDEKNITTYGRMAAIVDVYDAITASRVYHGGIDPQQALKKMLAWSGSHLDSGLVYEFIRCMSVYPVGTLVQLDNRMIAVVIEVHPRTPHKPSVCYAYDLKVGRKADKRIVNLSKTEMNINILTIVESGTYGIDPAAYL
jgi:HD-GYP domain-containing protein (c-di-GMP phosphodiesterase class II)